MRWLHALEALVHPAVDLQDLRIRTEEQRPGARIAEHVAHQPGGGDAGEGVRARADRREVICALTEHDRDRTVTLVEELVAVAGGVRVPAWREVVGGAAQDERRL